MARPVVRAWLSTEGRTDETDTLCEEFARYHIDSYFPALLIIAKHYHGDEFQPALQRQIAIWRDSERLHGVVDHVIAHGTPPPVRALVVPTTPPPPATLKLMEMVHKQKLAEADLRLEEKGESDIERKRRQVARW